MSDLYKNFLTFFKFQPEQATTQRSALSLQAQSLFDQILRAIKPTAPHTQKCFAKGGTNYQPLTRTRLLKAEGRVRMATSG